ncbi:MAG: peptide chain release factor N(5)-glutamine methyltransferase [Pseudomonadota bacterium]
MSTIGAWLEAHRDLDRLDRELLVCLATGLGRAQVLARPERPLAAHVAAQLQAWACRRRRGEPLAYIAGHREFWGLTLAVDPAVLVPRPETELLVEHALVALEAAVADGAGAPTLLDLGTGSGAIAVAIAVEAAARSLPVHLTATDVSAAALEVAAGNARRHGVTVRWLESDWLDAVAGRFDVIVSNPPYVAAADPHLPDLAFEPRDALVAGGDGLDALRRIIAAAPAHLHPGGHLLVEHGWDQGDAVRALFRTAGFRGTRTVADLAGLDRLSMGRHPGSAP